MTHYLGITTYHNVGLAHPPVRLHCVQNCHASIAELQAYFRKYNNGGKQVTIDAAIAIAEFDANPVNPGQMLGPSQIAFVLQGANWVCSVFTVTAAQIAMITGA